jgi:hypothetical protein
MLTDDEQKTIFEHYAKSINSVYEALDARVYMLDGTPVLQFNVFPTVRWEVHHSVSSPRLMLSQFHVDEDDDVTLIQRESFFVMGPTQLEIDDTEEKKSGNLLWIMWRLATTYFWMIKDASASSEEGFDVMLTLTAAEHLRPFYVMAAQNFSMDIGELATLLHVHGPYLRPAS